MAGVHQPMVGNTKKVRSQILSNLDFIPRFAGTLLSLWHAPLSMGSSSGITKLDGVKIKDDQKFKEGLD